MDVQRRYWQELSDLKRDARYIDLYHARTERTDRWLSIFAAVTSSASIGAWAVWQHLGPAWAFIIAASQVLSAVKEHLPYSKRLKALGALSPELAGLAISAEHDWYKVSRGLLTEVEIHDLYIALKRKKLDATQKAFPASSLPEARNLLETADRETQLQLHSYY